MRRIIVSILTALVVALGVSACGGAPVAEHPTPTAAPSSPVDVDSVFLAVVYDKYPDLSSTVAASDLVELAHQACDALDRGSSLHDVFMAVVRNTVSVEQAQEFGFVIGAGIGAYCPQYNDLISSGIPS